MLFRSYIYARPKTNRTDRSRNSEFGDKSRTRVSLRVDWREVGSIGSPQRSFFWKWAFRGGAACVSSRVLNTFDRHLLREWLQILGLVLLATCGLLVVQVLYDDFRSLRELGERTARPAALLVISAHWLTRGQTRVATSPRPRTIHDFSGFAEKAHAAGAMLTVATDLLALTLIKPPGEFGRHIPRGEGSGGLSYKDGVSLAIAGQGVLGAGQ